MITENQQNHFQWLRNITSALNALLQGKVETNSSLTLTANAATTVITDRKVGKDSVILLMPLTANAATALATTYIQTSDIDPRNNQFTVNHSNNAQTDRDFRYIVLGKTLN